MIMRRVKSKILIFTSSRLFLIDVETSNLVLKNHLYEKKELDS